AADNENTSASQENNKFINNQLHTTNNSIPETTLITFHTRSSQRITPLQVQNLSMEILPSPEKIHIDPDLTAPTSLNKKHNKRFSIGAFVGLHTTKNIFFKPQYSDNVQDLLNKGYQYELGSSAGLEVDFRFYKNMFVLTGLEHHQSKTEFNFTRTWSTTVLNSNSPTGYSNATATKVVRHHNTMRYYSIPLLVGIKKSIGRLEFGVSLGVHFNFTQLQTGKTLDENSRVVVFDATTTLPVSKFFMSYNCRPFINYQINNKLTIQLRVDGRYQHYGFSELYNLNHAALYMGLSIGSQYRF
ncbi:MAG: outer membrane beta-barrel protein, partial [Aureispira sp.]